MRLRRAYTHATRLRLTRRSATRSADVRNASPRRLWYYTAVPGIALEDAPLFAHVSAAALERLRSASTEFEAAPGQTLALAGDAGSGMFVILEGEAVVELRAVTYDLGPGDFFGELALLVPGAKRVARVRAKVPVRCLAIPRDEFLALLDSEPALTRALLDEIARRLVDSEQ
jgi:CRP-like cAMP-binding protein